MYNFFAKICVFSRILKLLPYICMQNMHKIIRANEWYWFQNQTSKRAKRLFARIYCFSIGYYTGFVCKNRKSQEIKLSIDRLQKIADILETDISTFFASSLTIQNQTNHEGAYGNGYVGNLHIENKETIKKLIQTLENENEHLKKEVEFLRSMVKTW